jgi:hypothetical protein
MARDPYPKVVEAVAGARSAEVYRAQRDFWRRKCAIFHQVLCLVAGRPTGAMLIPNELFEPCHNVEDEFANLSHIAGWALDHREAEEPEDGNSG